MRLNKGDIVKAGHAHMRRPMRGVESRLYLTRTALYHEGSIGQHIESVGTTIRLTDIKELKARKTLGIIPNKIRIVTKDNELFKFVVFKRDDWIRAIEQAIRDNQTPTA